MSTVTANSIQSVETINKDYRRAIVNGRRFDMMRTTGRGGPMGRRYTWTKWLITERNADGSFKASVETSVYGAETIKSAHRCIAKHIAGGGQ